MKISVVKHKRVEMYQTDKTVKTRFVYQFLLFFLIFIFRSSVNSKLGALDPPDKLPDNIYIFGQI